MEAMEDLMWGRTTFMIAHRVSTLENCDSLLVIEGGKLVTVTRDVSIIIKEMRMLPGLPEPAFHTTTTDAPAV